MSIHMLQTAIVDSLWQTYLAASPMMQRLLRAFNAKGVSSPIFDHLALIDLTSPHSGIPVMRAIFERLHFTHAGSGYLPDKQNAFQWLREEDVLTKPARDALPQVVVADFNLSALPVDIADVVMHYAAHIKPFPFAEYETYLHAEDEQRLTTLILNYFAGRAWPLPTCHDIERVQAVNELLAWVLVFGRQPNHFTFSIHLMDEHFASFEQFLDWIEHDLLLPLNYQGGRIKGSAAVGIQQASTHASTTLVTLADGELPMASPFIEFVWRYPVRALQSPVRFEDYFADFIAAQANNVVESLYDTEKTTD